MLFRLVKKEKDVGALDVDEVNLESAGWEEKDLENLLAGRIEDLVRTDQLMVIAQERKRQAEADIFAVDEKGTLFIFELKRWKGQSENLLQVLRYGQRFGRFDYHQLNTFYKSQQKGSGNQELSEAHREFFALSTRIPDDAFNREQQFVVVTNGLDKDTWDSIAYWKSKGIKIDSLIYRVYKIEDEYYIDFDPYGPIHDAPSGRREGLYVVNTNKTWNTEAYIEMVKKRKASAYHSRKYLVDKIKKGDRVCLYHVGVGVIGLGKARTDHIVTDYGDDEGEEHYVEVDFDFLIDLDDPNWCEKAVSAREINERFETGHRFRQTVFSLPSEYTKFIRERLKERGVKRPRKKE